MDYVVKIDDFEGPLDLLLHLVKESNIDIYDINIVDITYQYLEYIHQWEQLNIDIASEYLVMAATLMEIKSRALLPSVSSESDVLEGDAEIESRDTLIEKLVQYQKYKEITKNFKLLEEERSYIYTKAPERLNEMFEQKLVNDTDTGVEDLMRAFMNFLDRKNMERPIATKITNKEYSVRKRKEYIKKYLLSHGNVEFTELFDCYNKSYIIVTFLAILELAKEHDIVLKQDGCFSKIMIEQRV